MILSIKGHLSLTISLVVLQTQVHSPEKCQDAYRRAYASYASCYAHIMVHMQNTVSTEAS